MRMCDSASTAAFASHKLQTGFGIPHPRHWTRQERVLPTRPVRVRAAREARLGARPRHQDSLGVVFSELVVPDLWDPGHDRLEEVS